MTSNALDPITLGVIQYGFQQICNEMDLTFVRSAFCPVITEGKDRADGIYHRDTGELIAQGDFGLPIFVGTMQLTTAGCRSRGPASRRARRHLHRQRPLSRRHAPDGRAAS